MFKRLSFRDKFSKQTVKVFICASLPSGIRMGIVNLNPLQLIEEGEFSSIVCRDGFDGIVLTELLNSLID